MNSQLSENKFINILKYFIIIVLSTIPISIYILTLNNVGNDYIFPIFLNIHLFISFYLFCFSVVFHLDNLNKKVLLITFLSFLLVSLMVSISNTLFNYVYMPPADTPDFQVLLNRSIFLNIIFYIIMMLSYTSFNALNTDSISNFFTAFGDIFLWFLIFNLGSGTFFTVLIYAFLIVGFSIFSLFSAGSEIEFIIAKFIICIFIFLYSFIPFIAFIIYKKTKSIISIYISRIFLVFILLGIFIMIFLMLPYESRPYYNREVYIAYNVLMAFTIINLMFTRLDIKSNIFIKSLYIIVILFALLFDILTITATIYRIINYGLSPNKLTLIILNIIFFLHLILISINTIKSFIISFQNRYDNNTLNIVMDNKPIMFVYVYLVFSLFVCFVIPIIYIN